MARFEGVRIVFTGERRKVASVSDYSVSCGSLMGNPRESSVLRSVLLKNTHVACCNEFHSVCQVFVGLLEQLCVVQVRLCSTEAFLSFDYNDWLYDSFSHKAWLPANADSSEKF